MARSSFASYPLSFAAFSSSPSLSPKYPDSPTIRVSSYHHGYVCSAKRLAVNPVNESKPSDQLLTVPTSSERDVSISIWNWRGYRIRYLSSGKSGPALILIHGFGANSDHWRKNISFLSKTNRVYSIDLIGYGYSEKPNPREFGANSFYTFETWAAQLNEFCADVVKDDAFFICNSIGGVVGLQAAIMEPQICKGIFLLNISLRRLHIKKQPWYGRPFIKSFQSLLRNTEIGKVFYNAVATKESVKSILYQCYHDKSAVTDELVNIILQPGLDPGAAAVFLEFICYSGGPLPEDLLPKVKMVTSGTGDQSPHRPRVLGILETTYRNRKRSSTPVAASTTSTHSLLSPPPPAATTPYVAPLSHWLLLHLPYPLLPPLLWHLLPYLIVAPSNLFAPFAPTPSHAAAQLLSLIC